MRSTIASIGRRKTADGGGADHGGGATGPHGGKSPRNPGPSQAASLKTKKGLYFFSYKEGLIYRRVLTGPRARSSLGAGNAAYCPGSVARWLVSASIPTPGPIINGTWLFKSDFCREIIR